jgi:hypothetical protein
MSRNPSLAEVVNLATETALEGIYISLPGRVTRYNAATQEVDVQPIPRVRYTAESGEAIVEDLPVVPSAPVIFPGGGGFTVTFPISVGDTVLLVFSGVSLDKWLHANTDDSLDPETHARHSFADAVAIPGLKNFRRPRTSAPTDHVRIGTDGATAQGVGLGENADAWAATVKSWAAKVELALDGLGAVITPPLASPPDLSSSTVKVTS